MRARVLSCQEYHRGEDIDTLPTHCVPAHILPSPVGTILRRNIGPPLATITEEEKTFWEYLRSLGGDWMWENIHEGGIDVEWIKEAITEGSFLGVTDGSYDTERTKTVSGSGWVICCTKTRRLLRGSFFKILPKAGSYRGELLGLVALHTIVTAVAKFYKVDVSSEKICCNNVSALGQSSKSRKRVSSGIKHSDLHHMIRTIKCTVKFCMVYSHMRAHQDRILPWSMLTLEQQLNVICDELAKGAVSRYLSEGVHHLGPKFLPFEKAAVVLDGVKLTTDVGSEVRYRLGKDNAERFYTKPRGVIRGTNRGGLGWSSDRFHSVAWQALDSALKSKPDMFQLWLSKQCIGICATRQNMARIQDILDDKCPNCF